MFYINNKENCNRNPDTNKKPVKRIKPVKCRNFYSAFPFVFHSKKIIVSSNVCNLTGEMDHLLSKPNKNIFTLISSFQEIGKKHQTEKRYSVLWLNWIYKYC